MRVLRPLSAFGLGYLLGTVPSADVAARFAARGRVDLRRSGSRNPGGVNAFRVLGRTAAGVAAVVGHCYPLWNGFRGGKGVATSYGQCLYTFPAFAPFDLALAIGIVRLPGLRHPALVSTSATSAVWLLASVVWWRRGLPNSWGPPPTAALPLANAATVLVIVSRFARALRLRHPDDLELAR
jgi:glycerol-3-phosphate acyltransferase PlsY